MWKARACGEHKFCKTCAIGYVEEKIGEGQDIHCLFHDCPAVLTVEEIRDLVGNEQADMWERKRREHLPNYRNCPALNCTGYLLTTPLATQTQCPVCRLQLCSHCGKEWHTTSCDEVSKAELHESLAVKACPGCQDFIEKNKGCDHMTCQRCRHEWCWLCLQRYTPTHPIPGNYDSCRMLMPPINRPLPEVEELKEEEVDVSVSFGKVACLVLIFCANLPLAILIFLILTPLCYMCWPCIMVWYIMNKTDPEDQFWKICIGVLLWPVGPLFLAAYLTFCQHSRCILFIIKAI